MRTIVGSTAIKKYFPNFRHPKDLDLLSSDHTEFSSSQDGNSIIEIIPAPEWWVHSEYATLEEILTLKCSHIFWTIRSRRKHISDIEFLLRNGVKVNDSLFYRLYDHWKSLYGERSQSNQNLSDEEFFNDYLSREIHHDQIHLWINPNPVYKKILIGNGTVNICENKFNLLSDQDKINVVMEEVYVLSHERWSDKITTSPGLTFKNNLIYFIGHLAPTWLSLFAMKNYLLVNKPKIDYRNLINKNLEIWKRQHC